MGKIGSRRYDEHTDRRRAGTSPSRTADTTGPAGGPLRKDVPPLPRRPPPGGSPRREPWPGPPAAPQAGAPHPGEPRAPRPAALHPAPGALAARRRRRHPVPRGGFSLEERPVCRWRPAPAHPPGGPRGPPREAPPRSHAASRDPRRRDPALRPHDPGLPRSLPGRRGRRPGAVLPGRRADREPLRALPAAPRAGRHRPRLRRLAPPGAPQRAAPGRDRHRQGAPGPVRRPPPGP